MTALARVRAAWLIDAGLAALLTLVQAILVAPLFTGQFTQWRKSIEAAFVADARFIVEHFPDLSWHPDWYLGFPFELFYTPLFHAVVAVVGALIGDVPSAYRIVSASGYALGAAGIYTLARALGLHRIAATLATAIFVWAPSISGVFGGLFDYAAKFTGTSLPLPWRLQVMVEFGEGPHVFGLTLALFAAAALLRYLRSGGSSRFWVAVVLFLAVALTNLIALFGAAVFGIGCVVAGADRERLIRGARVAATAAVLSLVWYTPGFALAVSGFSAGGGEGGQAAYILLPPALALFAIPSFLIGMRHRTAGTLLFWCGVFATVVAAWYFVDRILAPQPRRYALELDAAGAIAIAGLVAWLASRLSVPRLRLAVMGAVAAAVLLVSMPGWTAVRPLLAPAEDWRSWSEREVALWLDGHLEPGERAYLSGDHAFWLNAFADVPQVRGGVDFAGVAPWWAHASYQINTGTDPRVSVLWLRALGVRYIVVTGPDSTEIYQDFARPGMFDGLLPLATVIQGARIYEVDRPHGGPVVVAREATPVPRDALDVAALEAYLARLDAGATGAELRLTQTGLAAWDGSVAAAERATLLMRTAFDSGWHVWIDDRAVPARPDALGLLAVDIEPGAHRIRLDHRVHVELAAGNALAFGFLALVALRRLPRGRIVGRAAGPAVVGAAVLAISVALGLVGGFPKGTDAPMHLARLRFVAENFPHHNWLYAWAAGMPTFDSYPALPYLAGLPLVLTIGAEPTLKLLALAAFVALGVGIYGHLVERGRARAIAVIAALMAMSSMAMWVWVIHGGAYARPVAAGFAALAWWAHARGLRLESWRWYAIAAALLAAAVSSHQVVGAVAALYVVGVHLSARGLRGLPQLAGLGGLALLLAAPTILPALEGGVGGGTILGVVRTNLLESAPSVLFDPLHVGLAAFVVPLGLVVAEFVRRPGRALLGAATLGAALLYVFGPNLRLPSQYYYVNGFEPFSMTFFVALAGALVYSSLAPDLATRRGRIASGAAVLLVGANLVLAVPAYAGHQGYPQVIDTTEPRWPEEQARRAIVVDGNDLQYRFLPLTADEAVWFTYAYRKPMLRDYYTHGRLHPDWLSWAYEGIYLPPLAGGRVTAILDWYAIDALTVPAGHGAETALAAVPRLQLLPQTVGKAFHQYELVDPSAIAVTSVAPIVAVIADRLGYDRIARLLFDDGTTPATRLPVWWSGTLADLPDDLAGRASAVVVVGDRLGARDPAAATAMRVAQRGGRVVWDLAGVAEGPLPAPWPVSSVRAVPIDAFAVTDRFGRIRETEFSPARYGEAPWGAQVLTDTDASAEVELALGPDALIATTPTGDGALTAVGGNLFFHALTYANAAERGYVLSFLGPAASAGSRDAERYFVDPETRVIDTDGSAVVLKESIHPGWSASWRGRDGAERPLSIRYTGPALMLVLPPGPGTVTFRYGGSAAGTAGLALAALGLLSLAGMAAGGRFPRLRRR